jgi:hypothetical protein
MLFSVFTLTACGGSDGEKSDKNTGIKLLPPKTGQIYFGAFPDFGGTEDQISTQRILDFERIANKKIAWATFSDSWYNGIKYPIDKIHAIQKSGSVPYVRIMPRSDELQGHAEQHFSLENIINGDFDPALKQWANSAKKDNIPLLVDFAVEANGDWFPWSGRFNGGSETTAYGDLNYPDGPERYRDAYRHIIDLFREEGVHHITWFYHYNYASFPNSEWNQPKYYYPGDDYIDWIGFSLYGAQTLAEEWSGLEFSTQLKDFHPSYLALKTTKPTALLEFGVTDHHAEGSKEEWLDDAFKTILNNPYITFSAINPWHESWENEDETLTTIRLDSSPKVEKTFKKWISDTHFISEVKF